MSILNTITVLQMTPDAIALPELQDSLEKDDAIPREATSQVIQWFGEEVEGGQWKLKMDSIVTEIGKDVLSRNKVGTGWKSY